MIEQKLFKYNTYRNNNIKRIENHKLNSPVVVVVPIWGVVCLKVVGLCVVATCRVVGRDDFGVYTKAPGRIWELQVDQPKFRIKIYLIKI